MSDAADKLARSRLAIIEHLQRRERSDEKKETRSARQREESEQDEQDWDQSEEDEDPARWYARLKRAAVAWWRTQPARLGVELPRCG